MIAREEGRDADGPSIAIRREIAILARQKRCRTSEWTADRPTEWRPHTVRDRNGEFFTDVGAWDFVADLVENGHPMRQVVLEHPVGKIAFTMTVRVDREGPEIYIKLRLSKNVIGYSFHYTVYS